MFKKIFFGLVVVITILGITAGTSHANKGGGEDYLVYVYEEETGNTLIYRAKTVTPVDLCGDMSLDTCHASPVGSVFYAYNQVLGRMPDVGGFTKWVEQNRSAAKLTQILLSSPEAAGTLSSDNYAFAGRMVVNAFGGYCYDSYCYGATPETDQAISNLAYELTVDRIQRSELAFNLLKFTKQIGTRYYDFVEYVMALSDGYDLGQLELIDKIEPQEPTCDYYTDTPELEDDCAASPYK